MVSGVVHGCLWTNIKGPVAPGEISRGTKTGKACAWNVLNLVAVGDVRVETAKREGKIQEISSIDYEAHEALTGLGFWLLPLFGRYCTVVTGN